MPQSKVFGFVFFFLHICDMISWHFQKGFTRVKVLVNFPQDVQILQQIYLNTTETVTKVDLLARATMLLLEEIFTYSFFNLKYMLYYWRK